MNWQAFWSGLLGTTIPGLAVALLVLRVTSTLNRSLERFKVDMQRDTLRFSQWHGRRVEACVAIYEAFSDFLDFLRQELYLSKTRTNLDPLHEFDRVLQKQIIFLPDELAEKVLRYKGELHQFRNDTILNNAAGTDSLRPNWTLNCHLTFPALDATLTLP